eukprot:6688571-Pyramimonas_sp.AAC.1
MSQQAGRHRSEACQHSCQDRAAQRAGGRLCFGIKQNARAHWRTRGGLPGGDGGRDHGGPDGVRRGRAIWWSA